MIRYTISNKEIKQLKQFNKIAKDSFKVYYVTCEGIAFAPRDYYKKHNRYSMVMDPTGNTDFLFQVLQLNSDSLIKLNHTLITSTTNKLSAVKYLTAIHNEIYLELSELKDKERELLKDFIEEINVDGEQLLRVRLGTIIPFSDKLKSIFKSSYPVTENIQWLSSTDIERIINKDIVILTDNGRTLVTGKPLYPGINDKSQVGISFVDYPENKELFIANIIILKEQIYSYHKYIGINM